MMKNELLLIRVAQIREGSIGNRDLAAAVDRVAVSGPFNVRPMAWEANLTSHMAWIINLGDAPPPNGAGVVRSLLCQHNGVTTHGIPEDNVDGALTTIGLKRRE